MLYTYSYFMHACMQVYGRQAKLPVEFTVKPLQVARDDDDDEDENDFELSINEHTSKMVAIRKTALENIEAAQERQKKQYNAKHSQDKHKYKVGALILLKNSRKLNIKRLKNGSKLDRTIQDPRGSE